MTDLYSIHAKEFSDTRQSPWKGWTVLLDEVKDKELRVLDLGCGNGRFLKFLLDSNTNISDYMGVDSSNELLEIAEANYPQYKFNLIDLENLNWNIKLTEKYNLIVAFGLMHHIHTLEQRRNLYKKAKELLEPGGIFCITFWQFLKSNKLVQRSKQLENENDYELAFGSNGATRFVHNTTLEEISELEKDLGFTLRKEYYSDGKEGNLNLYRIYNA